MVKLLDLNIVPGLLPNDVLRLVFEEAVKQDKRKAVKYALICKLVRSWVEVVLYQDVHLYRERTIRRFLHMLETSDKPDSYFSTHVKSLSIVYDKKTINNNIKILAICNGVQNLTIWAVPNQFSYHTLDNNSYRSAVSHITRQYDRSHLFMPHSSSPTEADFNLPSFHSSSSPSTSTSTPTPTSILTSTHSLSSTSSPILINVNELHNYYHTLYRNSRPSRLSIYIQHPLHIFLPNGPPNSPWVSAKASPHFAFALFENVTHLSIVNNWNDWVSWAWSWISPPTGFSNLKLLRCHIDDVNLDENQNQNGSRIDGDGDVQMQTRTEFDLIMNDDDNIGGIGVGHGIGLGSNARRKRRNGNENENRNENWKNGNVHLDMDSTRFLPKVTHLSLEVQLGKPFTSSSSSASTTTFLTPSPLSTSTSSSSSSNSTSTTSTNSTSNSNSSSTSTSTTRKHRKMIESIGRTFTSILTSPELQNLEVLLCILSFDDKPLETAFDIRDQVERILWNQQTTLSYPTISNQNQTHTHTHTTGSFDFGFSTSAHTNINTGPGFGTGFGNGNREYYDEYGYGGHYGRSYSELPNFTRKLVFAHDNEPFKDREAGSLKVERMWKNAEEIVRLQCLKGNGNGGGGGGGGGVGEPVLLQL